MPTWMRRFHIQKITSFVEKQNKQREDEQRKNKQSLSKNISGPNINPSSTYNFKK